MYSINFIEACAYETRKELVSEKEKIKCNNIKKKRQKND